MAGTHISYHTTEGDAFQIAFRGVHMQLVLLTLTVMSFLLDTAARRAGTQRTLVG